MIASDPPSVVHLITRAQGGLHDYQAFLHEAGHALHYAGCDPALPYTFRRLARDHALTEIYSYIVEAISREPGWHACTSGSTTAGARTPRPRSSSRRSCSAATRRSSRSSSTSGRASPATAARRTATRSAHRGDRRPLPADGYLADMDAGFYSADYLRAWIRSAQLRAHLRARSARTGGGGETGELLRELFREGTRAVERGDRRRGSGSTRSTPARSSRSTAQAGDGAVRTRPLARIP